MSILALLDDRGRITTDPMQARSARVVLDGGIEAVQPIDLRALAGRTHELELSTRAYQVAQTPRSMGYESAAPFCEERSSQGIRFDASRREGVLNLHQDRRALIHRVMRMCAQKTQAAPAFMERLPNLIRERFVAHLNPAYRALSATRQRMDP